MDSLQASQQATRWEGHDVSGTTLETLAFESSPNLVLYDLSGARAYILRDETANDIYEVVAMDFLQKPRDYITLVKDEKGEVIYRIEGDQSLTIQCEACQKNFTTKQSLERHKDRFPLCKAWVKRDEVLITDSVYTWANDLIEKALTQETNSKQCKFCQVEFASIGNFHKHFKTSVVCNRLGMREIKKAFAEA